MDNFSTNTASKCWDKCVFQTQNILLEVCKTSELVLLHQEHFIRFGPSARVYLLKVQSILFASPALSLSFQPTTKKFCRYQMKFYLGEFPLKHVVE